MLSKLMLLLPLALLTRPWKFYDHTVTHCHHT